MLYKRKGLPEVDEIVLCKVSKIFPNAVFVDLLEYADSGIVHISEVSPGRIRNLRDYVSVDRQIVCKVLRIDYTNRHIDLSLRRVNSTERQQKLEDIKQELKAELLIKNIATKLHLEMEKLYAEVAPKILKEYQFMYLAFKEVVSGELNLERLGIEKKVAQEISDAVVDKFKPKKIMIKSLATLQTYATDGVEKIKKVLAEIEKVSPTVHLLYLGGGRFKVDIEDIDYKPAEKNLKRIQEILDKFTDKLSIATLERETTE